VRLGKFVLREVLLVLGGEKNAEIWCPNAKKVCPPSLITSFKTRSQKILDLAESGV
jgi:hypothetical protein